jgi:hypothetical protein
MSQAQLANGVLPRQALRSLPASYRLRMVLYGYIPLLNVLIIVAICVLAGTGVWPGWTWLAAVAWLLLVPPIVVRITLALRPLPRRDIMLNSPAFLMWWFTAQWQTIFNRLPAIEEILRLVPGLYVTWLRLWGAKVGRLVYWSPGLRILDRSFLDIGDRVSFGAAVCINPHIIMPDATGKLVLRVATVKIGSDVLVGGMSVLLAGSWIADGEISMAKRELRPFTGWQNGKRVLPDDSAESEPAE